MAGDRIFKTWSGLSDHEKQIAQTKKLAASFSSSHSSGSTSTSLHFFDAPYSASTKRPRKGRDRGRVPRPPNAWILYRTQKNQEIVDQQNEERKANGGTKLKQSDVSRLISSMWQSETKEIKGKFADLARKRKDEHKILYPEYRYHPGLLQDRIAKPQLSPSSPSESISQNLYPGRGNFRTSATRSSREIASRSEVTTTDNSSGTSLKSNPGSSQATPSKSSGRKDFSFDLNSGQFQDSSLQHQQLSRPRALTDLKTHQHLSSPSFEVAGSSLFPNESSATKLKVKMNEKEDLRPELVRQGGEEEAESNRSPQTRLIAKPSAFLPPSYRPSNFEDLSLQSHSGGVGPRSDAFPIWPSNEHSPDSPSSSPTFPQQFQTPRSASATLGALSHNPFDLPLGWIESETQFDLDFQRRNPVTHSSFSPPYFSIDSNESVLSSSTTSSFPQSRDSIYSNSRQFNPEWNNGVGESAQELSADTSEWDSMASMKFGHGENWKGKGRETNNQGLSFPEGIKPETTQSHNTSTTSHSQNDSFDNTSRNHWRFQPSPDPRLYLQKQVIYPISFSSQTSREETNRDQCPSSALNIDSGNFKEENQEEQHNKNLQESSELLDKLFESRRFKRFSQNDEGR